LARDKYATTASAGGGNIWHNSLLLSAAIPSKFRTFFSEQNSACGIFLIIN
jgi:hypothetical protein